MCGSRQYGSSIPAGIFIPICTLIEFSPQAHVLVYCSQCIDIFGNLFFFFYNPGNIVPNFLGYVALSANHMQSKYKFRFICLD